METTSAPLATPLSTISPPFDTMDSLASPPDFLKMEEFDPTDPSDFAAASQTATPPPVIVQSKPAKKRKSWGQQLPEPKTTLPPRKRAKTDDEKEQRRIERIKRNRAAAHNSRERKRQEAEVLAVENAQLRTKLEAFEKHFGPLPKHIVLPEVTLCIDDEDTPTPSLIESRGSIATAPSPASLPDLYDYTTNSVEIKQEPHDSPFSGLRTTFDNLDGKQLMPTLAPLDETQHSAAMLCDLPCPSSRTAPRVAHPSPANNPSPSSVLSTTATLITLLNLNFLLTYRTLLQAMTTWTPSPSRPARATSASPPAWTSPLTTSSPRTASRTRSPSATALAQQHDAATAVARSAALRRPTLVGEVVRRDAHLGTAGVATRRGATTDVTGALRDEEGKWRPDRDDGVGRERS